MTWSFIAQGYGAGVTSQTGYVEATDIAGWTIAPGDLIVAMLDAGSATAITGVTDEEGHTYAPATPDSTWPYSLGARMRAFYAIAASANAIAWLRAAFSGTLNDYANLVLAQFRSTVGGIAVAGTPSHGAGTGTTAASGNITVPAASVLVGFNPWYAAEPSMPASWTVIPSVFSLGGYRLNVGAGTYSYDPPQNASSPWGCDIFGFSESALAAGGGRLIGPNRLARVA